MPNDNARVSKERYHRDILMAREEGKAEGRGEILDWLEQKYLGPDRPDRNTPEAAAILALVADAAKYLRGEGE